MGGCGFSIYGWWHFVIRTDHAVGHWVAEKNNQLYFEVNSRAIGLEKDGKIVAGLIYESWNKRSIVMHIAITGSMTRAFLAKIFDYPFRQLGAEKIIAPIFSANKRCIRLVTNMGFAQEAIIKDAHPLGDIVLFTMTRKECRFLGERYGRFIW